MPPKIKILVAPLISSELAETKKNLHPGDFQLPQKGPRARHKQRETCRTLSASWRRVKPSISDSGPSWRTRNEAWRNGSRLRPKVGGPDTSSLANQLAHPRCLLLNPAPANLPGSRLHVCYCSVQASGYCWAEQGAEVRAGAAQAEPQLGHGGEGRPPAPGDLKFSGSPGCLSTLNLSVCSERRTAQLSQGRLSSTLGGDAAARLQPRGETQAFCPAGLSVQMSVF